MLWSSRIIAPSPSLILRPVSLNLLTICPLGSTPSHVKLITSSFMEALGAPSMTFNLASGSPSLPASLLLTTIFQNLLIHGLQCWALVVLMTHSWETTFLPVPVQRLIPKEREVINCALMEVHWQRHLAEKDITGSWMKHLSWCSHWHSTNYPIEAG